MLSLSPCWAPGAQQQYDRGGTIPKVTAEGIEPQPGLNRVLSPCIPPFPSAVPSPILGALGTPREQPASPLLAYNSPAPTQHSVRRELSASPWPHHNGSAVMGNPWDSLPM